MGHVAIMKEVAAKRDAKKQEILSLGYHFSASIDFDALSLGELTDLADLQIGDQTYIGDVGDVTRTR